MYTQFSADLAARAIKVMTKEDMAAIRTLYACCVRMCTSVGSLVSKGEKCDAASYQSENTIRDTQNTV